MRNTLILLLFFIVAGCCRIKEDNLFNYPVHLIEDLDEVEVLSVTKIQDGLDLANFQLYDSLVISFVPSGSSFMSVSNYRTGESTQSLCPFGRGPEDYLSVSPLSHISKDKMAVVDAMKRTLSVIDIRASLESESTVVMRQCGLDCFGDCSPVTSTLLVNDSLVLLFNSAAAINPDKPNLALSGNPDYILFNVNSGEALREYKCFKGIPYKASSFELAVRIKSLLYSYECLNHVSGKVFCAMLHIPQINILDVNTGDMVGFRLKGRPKLDMDDPYAYFVSACTLGDKVYALYSGDRKRVRWDPDSAGPCSLYEFSWDGSLCRKFLLPTDFTQCASDGNRLYLSKITEEDSSLFFVNL